MSSLGGEFCHFGSQLCMMGCVCVSSYIWHPWGATDSLCQGRFSLVATVTAHMFLADRWLSITHSNGCHSDFTSTWRVQIYHHCMIIFDH